MIHISNFVIENSRVLKLSETSDKRAMTLEMLVCDSLANLNGDLVTSEFIKTNHQTLVNMPLQVDRFRLENGFYSSLTHRAEKGELKTDSVGVITDTWYVENEESGVTELYASAKIWKRYPATCAAIKELHDNEQLKFSWELVAEEVSKNGDVNEIVSGFWVGNCIVSNPSYPIAKSTMLVAELNELNLKEEVENLEILIAGMSIDMLRNKISMALNYDMYVVEMFLDDSKVVVMDWNDRERYIISFEINGEDVTVDVENKTKASIVIKPEDEVSEQDLKIAELEKENEELKTKVAELETVEEVIETAEETVEEEKEPEVDYAQIIAELTKKIETLEPLAEQARVLAEEKAKAELEELKTRLGEKAKSVLSKDDELTEKMLAAIEEADEKLLKIAIGEYVMERAEKALADESEVRTAETADVVIGVSDSDYNVGDDKREKIELF